MKINFTLLGSDCERDETRKLAPKLTKDISDSPNK